MPQVGGHRARGVLAVERFTGEWADVLSKTCGFTGGRSEVFERLAPLTAELVELLRTDRLDAAPARKLGDRLAGAPFRSPETLPASLRLIRTLGPDLFEVTGGPTRIGELLDEFAAGYAEGLRERTRIEQEALLNTVLRTRRHAEKALRASEQRFRAVFTEAGVGIAILSLDGQLVDMNPALRKLIGQAGSFAPSTAPGPIFDYLHPEDAPALVEDLSRLARGHRDSLCAEARLARADGSVIWVHLTASLVRDEQGEPDYVIGVLEDITERAHPRSRDEAHYDQLTRLPNRSLLDAQLRWVFSEGSSVRRVGLCHLDLDGFREINDSLGHEVGDRLLVAVAGRLQMLARDHLVTRTAADQFAILVIDPPDSTCLRELAEEIRTGLAPPFAIGSFRLNITVSLGIAEAEVTSSRPAELQRAADAACSWAKTAGGGRWAMFDPERDAGETIRFTLAASVSAAVDRNEFRLLYQPLIDLASGELTGVEALVRWCHPEHGLLGPGKFIELAERNGAIVPLGRWVLTEACRQARHWADQFGVAAPYVSVNVAPRQLIEPGWLGEVSAALSESGLDPRRLQLEITERAVLANEAGVPETLRTLRDMGVRLTIDDFGTGYSSLAYLRELPVHGLKIDGSFIRGLAGDAEASRDGKIVEALIDLAHALGLVVTAEWVETAAQDRWLAGLGCDVGQGIWYGEPAPPGRLTQLLRRPLAG